MGKGHVEFRITFNKRETGDYEDIKNRQMISDIKNIILDSFAIIPLYKSLDEQKCFVKELVGKIASMINDKTFYLYAAYDLEDQEKFYSILSAIINAKWEA